MNDDREVVEVTYGLQKFSPVSYQTFDVGPFSIRITKSDHETEEQAFKRGYAFLERQARVAFKAQLADFLQNVKEAAEAARGGKR